MKSLLKIVLVVSVPVLGLISCSQDRHTDDWQMSQPTVEGSGQPSLVLNAASRRTLAQDSALKFSGPPFETLNVRSTCVSGDQTATGEARLSRRDAVLLREIWAVSFIKSLSESELEKSECDFDFLASNANGSTQAFRLDHIKLSSFSNRDVSARLLSAPGDSAFSLSTSVAALANEFGDDGEIILACGKSSASLSNRAVSRTQDLVRTLQVQLGLRGRQACHFVALEHESDGRTRFEMTDDVPVRFASVPLNVSVSNPIEALSPAPRMQLPLPVVQIGVMNSSSETTYVKIQDPQSIHLRLLYHGNFGTPGPSEYVEPSTTIDAPVNLLTTGGHEIATAADATKTYELRAHEMLTVQILIGGSNRLGACLDDSADPTAAGYVGFRYGFDSAFSVLQTDAPGDKDTSSLFEISASGLENMRSSVVFSANQAMYGKDLTSISGSIQRKQAGRGCFAGYIGF